MFIIIKNNCKAKWQTNDRRGIVGTLGMLGVHLACYIYTIQSQLREINSGFQEVLFDLTM